MLKISIISLLLIYLLLINIISISYSNEDIETPPEEDLEPGNNELSSELIKVSKSFKEKIKKKDKKNKKDNNLMKRQKQSMIEWANTLTENDYNSTDWRYKFRSVSTTDYFDQYLIKLSKIFYKNNAIINFAMIGACDGKTDPTIKYRFLKYPHWRGVFVEPMTINIRDLNNFISENGAANRSHIIQAAVTELCDEPYILVERPLYEEKDPNTPHWLRRQIGAIVPNGRTTPRSKDWIIEKVECLTPSEVLKNWATATITGATKKPSKSNKVIKRRPHILKIDVEGHDFQVLTGFISANTPRSELPLLVEFEAKSIAEKFPLAKQILESRGYVVSNFGQDGFAMLKGSEIGISSSNNKQSSNQNDKKVTTSSDSSEFSIPDADMYV